MTPARASGVELTCQILQGPMKQDADSTFGSIEDLADLPRTQAIGEAQQDDLAAIVWEGRHRRPDAPGLLGAQRQASRIGIRCRRLERDRLHRLGAPP